MNIKEIAKIAGVSSATISRVINNSGYVKEETRQKVLKAIEAYNYVPSDIARSLSISDSRSIGVIIPDIENEFFSKVISGISEAAEKYRYNIVFLGTNENSDREHDSLKVVESQRLKGVIITPISETDNITRDYLMKLKASGIPVVLVDRDLKDCGFDGVFVDNKQGAYEGVKALINAGHRKIGIICGPETSKPGRERFKGYKMALDESNIEIPDEYIEYGDFKIDKAYSCMKRLLELDEPPTAVFSSNNLTTLGCLKCITEHKLKLGRDISLIGFDDIDSLRMIDFRLSVVDRDAREQGKMAMELLEKCLENGDVAVSKGRKVNLPHRVILRGSELQYK